ncbi:hypothetical protein [Desulfallas thermosapovorans]|uniref:Uncharacterized protein n=1 Tax=Desulfallas thermosapovorans DSM 6562 TaxID=1121431 RepID=A0A5S4ZTK1_9FIRM|nr:hypothetical protein [Desulfallas thermosapovorans]TYO96014.1 hypothetical protein LX24_01404 [Desulfallas thermosapovorans DSM 6562]
MLIEGAMILTWLSAGAAVGSLLTYRFVNGTLNQEMEEKLRSSVVENEALSRTNSIYRERIEQLENTLFSNEKYLEMAGEIERLSAENFKLRGRLRDLACLVEAEKKKTTWERVEQLEKSVLDMRRRMENGQYRPEVIYPVGFLPARSEIAATVEEPATVEKPGPEKPKKWASILRARKL